MKLNKILVVVPSRGRPVPLLGAVASILSTSCGYADVLIAVDADDTNQLNISSRRGRVSTVVMPERMSMLHILNAAIMPLVDSYDVFGFSGDDVTYSTQNWDAIVWSILRHKAGVVYGDDGIQRESLPTHPWFSASIVKAVGRVAPPSLRHYYFDNYLKALTNPLGMLYWRKDLVTAHKHHSVGGVAYDLVYREAESKFQDDKAAFALYQRSELHSDLVKVKALTDAGAVIQQGSHTPSL